MYDRVSSRALRICSCIDHRPEPRCSIPDDHISPRRSALFLTRSFLRGIREGGPRCKSGCINVSRSGVSRSGLDRCLRRHGVGNLRDLKVKTPRPRHSAFKACEPGCRHTDVKYLPRMADETRRRYLFGAIDRATRWVFIRVFTAKTAANARRFLRDLEWACPMRIRMILTDNGKEFAGRLFGLRKPAAKGTHEIDKTCTALNIEHRLTPPKSPPSVSFLTYMSPVRSILMETIRSTVAEDSTAAVVGSTT